MSRKALFFWPRLWLFILLFFFPLLFGEKGKGENNNQSRGKKTMPVCSIGKAWVTNKVCNIYFWLRFGLTNAINDYLSYQIWVGIIFVSPNSLKQTFKNDSGQKITFRICVLVLWIHKCYFVVKNWCEMFILKLFSIQNLFQE